MPWIPEYAARAVPSGRTIVLKTPPPPSIAPLIDPAASKKNVSLPPARFSTPVNVTPATSPLSAPEIVQVASAAGPMSVSLPAPPSNETAIGGADWKSSASTSSRSLPTTSTRLTSASATESTTSAPPTVSTSSADSLLTRSLPLNGFPVFAAALAVPLSTCQMDDTSSSCLPAGAVAASSETGAVVDTAVASAIAASAGAASAVAASVASADSSADVSAWSVAG